MIARESSDEDDVVQVELRHDGVSGFGEAAPIERYGESGASALAYVEAARPSSATTRSRWRRSRRGCRR